MQLFRHVLLKMNAIFQTITKSFSSDYLKVCLRVKVNKYSRFRLIGPPVNRVSRLIGPNCEERNPIKDNALR